LANPALDIWIFARTLWILLRAPLRVRGLGNRLFGIDPDGPHRSKSHRLEIDPAGPNSKYPHTENTVCPLGTQVTWPLALPSLRITSGGCRANQRRDRRYMHPCCKRCRIAIVMSLLSCTFCSKRVCVSPRRFSLQAFRPLASGRQHDHEADQLIRAGGDASRGGEIDARKLFIRELPV
jgi:hypothetical protein